MKKIIETSLIAILALALLGGPAGAALIYIVDSGQAGCYGSKNAKITTIDSVTGLEQTLNPGTGHNLTDVAVTPSGQRLYAVGKNKSSAKYLYRYDPITGAELNKWNLGTGKFNNALVGESETSLLLMAGNSSKLWRVNLDAVGDYLSTTLLGNVGFTSEGDLAIGLDGTLYAAANPTCDQGYNSQLYSINLNGGVSSNHIGDMGRTNFYGLAVDEQGVLYAGRGEYYNGDKIYTVNTSTGATSYALNPNLPRGIYGMASVPEPATLLVLIISGLVVIGGRITRKYRAAA
ncbi:MAG: hypothetical protein GWP14_01635 [Actinobacteria bacterium]|nr:hypothetical protein [Actinomycetota bacterium]